MYTASVGRMTNSNSVISTNAYEPKYSRILDLSFLQFHITVLKFQNPVPVSGSNFLPIDPPTVGRISISAVHS